MRWCRACVVAGHRCTQVVRHLSRLRYFIKIFVSIFLNAAYNIVLLGLYYEVSIPASVLVCTAVD